MVSNGWIQEEEVPGCQYILKYPAKLVFIVFGLFWRKQIRRIVASVLIKAVWNIVEAKFQNGKFQSLKIFFLILITILVMMGKTKTSFYQIMQKNKKYFWYLLDIKYLNIFLVQCAF